MSGCPVPATGGGECVVPSRCIDRLCSLAAASAPQGRRAGPGQAAVGGELIFVVPSEPPSYDGHQEETFGVTHPIAPHYNTLLRVDPFDKTGTKPVGDLAESWTISKDGS